MDKVLINPLDKLSGLGRDREAQRALGYRPEDAVEGEGPPLGIIRDNPQVIQIQPVDLVMGEEKEAPSVLEISQGLNKGDDILDLFLGIEAAASGEPEGDLFHVQSPEERVGVGIAPDEDGHLSQVGPLLPFLA